MTLPAGERILYVLTASGSLSFAQLSRVLSRVREGTDEEDSLNLERWIAATNLSALGHCEWISDGETQKIFPTRAVLARLPVTGLPTAVLVGGRQPETIEELRKASASGLKYSEVIEDVLEDRQSISPNRIMVQAESSEAIEAMASSVGIPYLKTPPAWDLASASPKLKSVVETIAWSQRPILDWKRTNFDPLTLRFVSHLSSNDPLILIRYIHPHSQQPHYELRRDTEAAFIGPEWGRYAVLDAMGQKVLRYDSRRHLLGVPVGARLPRILARATCLCSGLPPLQIVIESQRHEVFTSVPPKIADLVGACLSQEIRAQTIRL